MNLIRQEDGTLSLNANLEDMRLVIAAISYIQGKKMEWLYKSIDYNSLLHPENCMHLLDQVLDDVDITEDGKIKPYMLFRVSEDI